MEQKIQLQKVGIVPAIKAMEIKVGMKLLWNNYGIETVLSIFEKGEKSLLLNISYIDNFGEEKFTTRTLRKTRLVAITN